MGKIQLEWLHIDGCKAAVLNWEGNSSAECKGLISYAAIASKDGGAAHYNLLGDNLSS